MKKIQIHIKILFTLFIALIITSCENVVQVDIDNENLDLITVEAYINTTVRNNILVKLEKSLPVDDSTSNPPINNAVIEISDDAANPNIVLLKEDGTSGFYTLPRNTIYKTQPGRTYTISITTPDGTVITGQDYMQKMEPLDTVKVNLSDFGDNEYLAVFISTQEMPGLGNYYKWDIYINNHLLYNSDNMAFGNDELVDGNYIYDLEIFTDWYEEKNEDENDNADSDKIIFIGDTVKVVQSSISSDVYDFYLGMQNQAFAGSPFSVPPANIPGNLKANNNKKVLGLFSARDISIGNEVVVSEDNFTPLIHGFNF